MKDLLRFGSKIGDYTITGVGRHGTDIQRYKAIHRKTRAPVLISCTMYDKTRGPFSFEARAEYRAALDFGVPLIDWGKTEHDLFYLVEPDLQIQPLASLPHHSKTVLTLFWGYARTLNALAKARFLHGALEPLETVGLANGKPVIYGVGFRQILGCESGLGMRESDHIAPEMIEGKRWDERADIYSLCSILGAMWKGQQSEEDFLRDLGVVSELLKAGLRFDAAERVPWADLMPALNEVVRTMIERASMGNDESADLAQWLAEEAKSEAGSDKRRIRATHRDGKAPSAEVFADWLLGLDRRFEHEGIASIVAEPIGTDAVDVLRRVPLESMTLEPVSESELAKWAWQRDQVKHENVPVLVGAGIRDGFIYLAEVTGIFHSWAQWIKKPKLSKARGLRTMRAIASAGKALEIAAKRGMYHGDLLPQRDLIVEEAESRVLVLGIGALQAFGLGRTCTKSPYASPERRAGEAFDHRADIYALAAILRASLSEKCKAEVEWFSANLFDLALAPNPQDRFATWELFLAALDRGIKAYTAHFTTPTHATRHAAPSTAPAQTPTSSEGSKPSSSDPRPSPAPQGRPAAQADQPANAEAISVLAPKAERGEKLAATLESVELDRITLPSPAFVSTPSNQQRAGRWIASGMGLAVGVAAAFALLWSARVPVLAPLEEVQSPPAFEAPAVLWTISTAQAPRLPEKPRAKPHEFAGVAYRFDINGQSKGE